MSNKSLSRRNRRRYKTKYLPSEQRRRELVNMVRRHVNEGLRANNYEEAIKRNPEFDNE